MTMDATADLAVLSTETYRLLSQGRTKPFQDPALLFGYLVRLAQPIMKDFQSDLFWDARWLETHACHIRADEPFTWHWYVSDSHTTIHASDEPYKAYGDKLHYRFTLYLDQNGWWTLMIEHLAAVSPITRVACRTCGEGGHQIDGQCVRCATNPSTAGK